MAEPRQIGEPVREFADLAHASDELLRQVASRVHIIDLAYAFSSADADLRERLYKSVRPHLADEIRAAINTVESSAGNRAPSEEQIATARARVMEVVRTESTT
jgi:hypothetical protein